MSKKLNAMDFTRIMAPVLAMPRKKRDDGEQLLRDMRLAEEAVKVSAYNRLRVPIATPGPVTYAEAEEASGKGQGDATS